MFNLSERKYDKLLNIKTRGTRESKNIKQYRYEATPYSDLLLLFDLVKLNEEDTFVDLGSGKGRLCFLVNHLFNANTLGIEVNEVTHGDALKNLNSYYLNKKDNDKIKFVLSKAEKYHFSNENYFFFFNPFDLSIFKQVINNILISLKKNDRKITVILAYPFIEFVDYIITHPNFIVTNYIENKNDKKFLNKFLILENI